MNKWGTIHNIPDWEMMRIDPSLFFFVILNLYRRALYVCYPLLFLRLVLPLITSISLPYSLFVLFCPVLYVNGSPWGRRFVQEYRKISNKGHC